MARSAPGRVWTGLHVARGGCAVIARSNVVQLFPSPSPAELEEWLEIWRRIEAMDATQRGVAIAGFNQRIEVETHPALKTAFTKMRDLVAKLGVA